MNLGALSSLSVIRTGIAAVWVLSPAVLVALAIREWTKNGGTEPGRKMMPIVVAFGIAANWVSFLLMFAGGFIGGFGTHFVTTRMANWFVVGSLLLLVVAAASKVARGKLTLASLLVLALWLGSVVVA